MPVKTEPTKPVDFIWLPDGALTIAGRVVARGDEVHLTAAEVDELKDPDGNLPRWLHLVDDPDAQEAEFGHIVAQPGSLSDPRNLPTAALLEVEADKEAARQRQHDILHGGAARHINIASNEKKQPASRERKERY